jgi:hypothetical protein
MFDHMEVAGLFEVVKQQVLFNLFSDPSPLGSSITLC